MTKINHDLIRSSIVGRTITNNNVFYYYTVFNWEGTANKAHKEIVVSAIVFCGNGFLFLGEGSNDMLYVPTAQVRRLVQTGYANKKHSIPYTGDFVQEWNLSPKSNQK